MAKADAQYGPIFAKYAAMPIEQVAQDEQALKWAAACLPTARSATALMPRAAYGFPNLTDNDWLYGGEPETLKTTIMGGRQAAMPAWKDIIGEEGIRNVAAYIRTLSGLKNPQGIEVDLHRRSKTSLRAIVQSVMALKVRANRPWAHRI